MAKFKDKLLLVKNTNHQLCPQDHPMWPLPMRCIW